MKNLAFGALLMGLLVACGGGDSNKVVIKTDGGNVDGMMACNPLTQAGCAAGEKCTWIVDAVMPQYVGHTGCAPDGSVAVGGTCKFNTEGPMGYDNCAKGGVCSSFVWGTATTPTPVDGTCKQICDQLGGAPACPNTHVCVSYSRLFSTGEMTAAAGGVCDLKCDPLLDNDFDGSNGINTGPASARRANTCGTNPNIGCYGYPSFGTPPASGWSCTGDINATANSNVEGLRHRVKCLSTNGCANGTTIYVNSCNQGYLPLLQETSFSSQAICVAMCKPANCYKGMNNCGDMNASARRGVDGDRCTDTDRRGTFDIANDTDGGEHCQHLWWFEIDNSGNFIESDTSDSLGFCYNHDVYYWDKNGNGTIEMATDEKIPNCGLLGSSGGTGSGTDALTRFSALSFGCVDTSFLPTMANGKKMIPQEILDIRSKMDVPRALYHRTMGTRE